MRNDDDKAMREDPRLASGLIRRCFNAAEMAYLQQQDAFKSVSAAINTFDDFEAVAELGDELLFNRDEIQWRAQYGNPITSSTVHARSATSASIARVTLSV